MNRLGYSCSCKMSTFFFDVATLFTYASLRQQSRRYRFPKSYKCLYLEYFYKCHASVTANKHSVIDALKLPVHFPGRSSCSCPLFYSLYSETADVTLAGNFQSAFSVVGNDKTRTTVGLLGAWYEKAAPHAPWFLRGSKLLQIEIIGQYKGKANKAGQWATCIQIKLVRPSKMKRRNTTMWNKIFILNPSVWILFLALSVCISSYFVVRGKKWRL